MALAAVLGAGLDAPEARRDIAAQAVSSAAAAETSATLPLGVLDSLLGSQHLATAAEALRRRDCTAALSTLETPAAGADAAAGLARTVLGLHAHACEQPERAEKELLEAAGSAGPLEDWRLFALGDSAAARGNHEVARAALGRLLSELPDSPLRPRALLRSAELAWEAGDHRGTLVEAARARREELSGAEAIELEALVWQLGEAADDRLARASAARRLLVEAPLRARELGVEAAGESHEWIAGLSPNELLHRAETFLAGESSAAALSTLDLVPEPQRQREWVLLAARVLTAEKRGSQALSRLRSLTGASPSEQAELEWLRALASLDASRAVRGRTNLPSTERAVLREEALGHLTRVASIDPAGPLAPAALRKLFREIGEDGPFEQRLQVLKLLRHADPSSTTGASHLWELGWRDYERRNHTTAIGYWAELGELYPEHYYARSARYWTGRALEAMGEVDRGRRVLTEIASADTTDFYRRHALARLRAAGVTDLPAAAPPGAWPPTTSASQRWPSDPTVDRVRLLSDLGLDDLALLELEAVREWADPQAAQAVEAEVLGRMGRRRESIPRIRSVFPQLGTAQQAGIPAAALRLYYPVDFEAVIRETARLEGLPDHVVLGMIRQESAFDVQAKSWAGAHGLMQVMPATGREVARKLGLRWSTSRLQEPSFNVRLGTAYFSQVLSMFEGDLELALAGYNGGPYRLKRLWRDADRSAGFDTFLEGLGIPESRTYVKRILVLSDSYGRLYPESGDASAPLGSLDSSLSESALTDAVSPAR